MSFASTLTQLPARTVASTSMRRDDKLAAMPAGALAGTKSFITEYPP
jgi:hypothetical protein